MMEDYEAYAKHARLMTSVHAAHGKRCELRPRSFMPRVLRNPRLDVLGRAAMPGRALRELCQYDNACSASEMLRLRVIST